MRHFAYKRIPKLLLSATPIKELYEIYPPVKLLQPYIFGKYYEFLKTYFIKLEKPYGGVEYYLKENADREIFDRCGYLFFRKDVKVTKTNKNLALVRVPTPEEYSWSNFLRKLFSSGKDLKEIKGKFIELFREASLNNPYKIKAIELLLTRHDPNKTVVYTYFVDEAKLLHSHLKSKGIDNYLITGDTPEKERNEILQKQDKLIIFTKVFSESVNLPNYDTMIFMTCPSTIKDYKQLTGRIDRLTQQANSLHYYIIADEYNRRYFELLQKRKSLDSFLKELIREHQRQQQQQVRTFRL